MSVRPTLLKDLQRSALQRHQANIGTGSYNRYEALSPRGRTFSAGKRQLDRQGEDEPTAKKPPRLDNNLIFTQLKEHDTILAEAEKLIAEMESSNTENPDPRYHSDLRFSSSLVSHRRNLLLL
jgi:hypothetical protein